MNKRTKSFLLSILTLSFIFYSCSNLANDLQKRKNQNLFNITIQETSNGTVTTAKSSGIKAGEEVILSVTATTGYELKTISVTNTQNKDVAVATMEQGTSYKFTMPASDVTVSAAFDKTGPVDITEPGDLNNSSGDTVYKIEHCQQSLTDTGLYDLVAIQYKRGNAGDQTTAVSSDFSGFTALAFDQQPINSNGNTIVRIYYDRNIITYTFDPNGGNWDGSTEPIVLSGLYEAVVNIPEDPDGYGYTFTGWDKSNLQLFGPENQTITACWDADNTTSYTVREYLQSVEGGNNYTLDKEYQRTGSVLTFTPETQYGFDYNIAPLYLDSNGNGVVNVYYDRKYYTVSFVTNGGNSIEPQQLLYQANPTQIPVRDGYTFYSWYTDSNCENIFDINKGIVQDTILYAFWKYNSITYEFHETVESLPAGTDGTFGKSGEYVLFGDYPQSLLANNVSVDENKTMKMGKATVYEGSDKNLYYKYNGNYYKVEPIKWRVISRDENNLAVLFAENILDISAYGRSVYDGIYTYSLIHSFLNNDFLSEAFTESAQDLIEFTNIGSDTRKGDEHFSKYSEDKIYLLKYSEVQNSTIFPNNSTKRTFTGFAANKKDSLQGNTGEWWIRSSYCPPQGEARYMAHYYRIYNSDFYSSTVDSSFGVVPALSIYLPPAN